MLSNSNKSAVVATIIDTVVTPSVVIGKRTRAFADTPDDTLYSTTGVASNHGPCGSGGDVDETVLRSQENDVASTNAMSLSPSCTPQCISQRCEHHR
jgi:hypothetical protein